VAELGIGLTEKHALLLSSVAAVHAGTIRGGSMKFVVKISNSVGQAAWLASVAGSEFHSVGELEHARLFKNRDDANHTIVSLPRDCAACGISFAVVPLDTATELTAKERTLVIPSPPKSGRPVKPPADE
jgi:hypothetical protein